MKIIVIKIICGILLLSSCNSSNSKKKGQQSVYDTFEEKTNLVLHALRTADTTIDYISSVPVSISSFVMENLTDENSISIVYPLDGSCSYCIAEFLNLLQTKKHQ